MLSLSLSLRREEKPGLYFVVILRQKVRLLIENSRLLKSKRSCTVDWAAKFVQGSSVSSFSLVVSFARQFTGSKSVFCAS